jgi:hypothetical protein
MLSKGSGRVVGKACRSFSELAREHADGVEVAAFSVTREKIFARVFDEVQKISAASRANFSRTNE